MARPPEIERNYYFLPTERWKGCKVLVCCSINQASWYQFKLKSLIRVIAKVAPNMSCRHRRGVLINPFARGGVGGHRHALAVLPPMMSRGAQFYRGGLINTCNVKLSLAGHVDR
jgi:hypothetical protein